VILPRAWFYDLFIARATALVLLGVGYAMFFTLQLQGAVGYPKNLLLLTVPAVAVILALAYGVGKVSIARKVLEAFADRALIFLYFSIPLSLISLCVVAIRNLF